MLFSGVHTDTLKKTETDENCIVYYVPWDDSEVKKELLQSKNKETKKIDNAPALGSSIIFIFGVICLITAFVYLQSQFAFGKKNN